ncbi:hypothetical protein ACFT1B_18580 [Streptomyces griseoincarnatus]
MGEKLAYFAFEAFHFLVGVLGEGPVDGSFQEAPGFLSCAESRRLKSCVCGGR